MLKANFRTRNAIPSVDMTERCLSMLGAVGALCRKVDDVPAVACSGVLSFVLASGLVLHFHMIQYSVEVCVGGNGALRNRR